ncbi:MAG: zinc ribbon domain-containing protein [Ignavibacteria bacterium]|nr:zinc ribbon domain-containing protein [Ignavibacteria bacterium]
MPVFEYRCTECNSKYEILHLGQEKAEDIFCPSCNSKNHKKLLSAFSPSMGSSSGFSGDACSTGACDVPSYGGCASGMCGLN